MSLCVDTKSQDLGGVVFLEPGVTIRCPANKKLWESLLCGGQELEEVIVFVDLKQEGQVMLSSPLVCMCVYFRNH